MPEKHALLVGINKYPHYKPEDKQDLNGCVNDTLNMRNVLVSQFGFPPENVVLLHDAAATRPGIFEAMDALTSRIAPDDIVVFHHSGHGRLRGKPSTDRSEGTGHDCMIMTYDTGPAPVPLQDIQDYEIQGWLERLTAKTRNVTLIFDCCFSGTITRDAFSDTARAGTPDSRPVETSTPESLITDTAAAAAKSASGWLATSDKYVVISGCEDLEKSYEFTLAEEPELLKSGALSHFLTEALVEAKPGTTYRDLFESVSRRVTQRNSKQHPQIEGTLDRELFGIRDIEPMRYVAVQEVDGQRVTLGGGMAHGLQVGSQWAVYPPGTKRATPSEQLGLIDITEVGAVQSTGMIAQGEHPLVENARCVQQVSASPEPKLFIDLSAVPQSDYSTIADRIEQSPMLSVAPQESSADLRAYVVEPRVQVGPDDLLPELTNIEKRSWAFVDRSAARLMPLHATDESAVLDTVVENLEKRARYRNWLAIANPNSELDIDFNIYRRPAEGERELANGGDFVFREGELIQLEIISREREPFYYSVLDFGVDGAVQVLYPPPSQSSELVAADKADPVVLGDGQQRIELSLNGLDVQRARETFKLVCTRQRADFGWLNQQGFRSATTGNPPLDQLAAAAESGQVTTKHIDAATDWLTIDRSFVIERSN